MTDKQIIIDGVDVSECDRHCSDNHNRPNMCYCEMTGGYSTCRPKDNQCNFYIKSIEKQLKRKEQECNKLKQTLAEIKEIAKKEVHTRMLFADNESFCDFSKILQKISEVVDD